MKPYYPLDIGVDIIFFFSPQVSPNVNYNDRHNKSLFPKRFLLLHFGFRYHHRCLLVICSKRASIKDDEVFWILGYTSRNPLIATCTSPVVSGNVVVFNCVCSHGAPRDRFRNKQRSYRIKESSSP